MTFNEVSLIKAAEGFRQINGTRALNTSDLSFCVSHMLNMIDSCETRALNFKTDEKVIKSERPQRDSVFSPPVF